MSYAVLTPVRSLAETTSKPPPSILVMPMVALFSVGLFAYLFREDIKRRA